MFNKKLIVISLSIFSLDFHAANLIIAEGSYKALCLFGDENIYKGARENAFIKLPGDKEDYEQISKWKEDIYTGSDVGYCSGYVSASFIRKSEEYNDRFVQTIGSWAASGPAWEKAQRVSLENAKFYCNTDYNPEFLKIVNKKIDPIYAGLFYYIVTADYRC
ncbi:MAG: hypothetical protein KBD25_03470 [Rickettsiaceae bacterium]|nr:hypothetical protein [Rickettsiaceae bacterium]